MTPEQIEALKTAVENLRLDSLFENDLDPAIQFYPDAEMHFLLALGALEAATRFLTLAKYAQMQKR